MVWLKFRFPFKCTGKHKTRDDYVTDVNEEYLAVHRTRSYIEIIEKVEAQLRRKSFDSLTSSPFPSRHINLSEYILEPRHEILVSIIEGSNDLHPLIISYFQASFEACNTCVLLLESAQQVRRNYKRIQTVINLTNGSSDHQRILDELASFTVLSNPMMDCKPAKFRDLHINHNYLLSKLTEKLKNIRKKETVTRYAKKIRDYIGICTSPRFIACSFGLVRRNKLEIEEPMNMSLNERLGMELEAAAKGVFLMINEFDTMSMLVKRLYDEIEHIKNIGRMCVKNEKDEVLIEVVKELKLHQMYFLDQLEELEEHIYLCFLTLNRSRMLVYKKLWCSKGLDEQKPFYFGSSTDFK